MQQLLLALAQYKDLPILSESAIFYIIAILVALLGVGVWLRGNV